MSGELAVMKLKKPQWRGRWGENNRVVYPDEKDGEEDENKNGNGGK